MDRTRIFFPVRFATRAAAVQTTSRELSKSGVGVRCLEPPPVGTIIALLPSTKPVKYAVSAQEREAAEAAKQGAVGVGGD